MTVAWSDALVLQNTLIHEFGHYVLIQALGFDSDGISVHSADHARTHTPKGNGGLLAVTGYVNQHRFNEAGRVAIAGVSAEQLSKNVPITVNGIQAILEDPSNLGDLDLLRQSIEQGRGAFDLHDAVHNVEKILKPAMNIILDAANSGLRWFIENNPELPSPMPYHVMNIVRVD